MGYMLPVQFLSFTGVQQNKTVKLNWVIIAEEEVDRFEIDRSTDNSTFSKIITEMQHVALHIQQSYFTIANITGINNEILYCRLKVIGEAGEIKYSNVIVIRFTQAQKLLTVSLNPANNYFKVSFNTKKQKVVLRLIYNLGVIVFVEFYTQNCQSASPGYFVKPACFALSLAAVGLKRLALDEDMLLVI